MSKYNKEISFIKDIIKKSTEITEWFYKNGFDSYKKKDHSLVTLADFASQVFLISKLKEEFPEDQIIAEETESSLINKIAEKAINNCLNELGFEAVSDIKATINYCGQSSSRQWTVDPIDGTLGFQKGLSYAIGISLMIDSDPQTSAIAAPNYNEKGLAIFVAEKNQGAKASYGGDSFKSIKVSTQNNIKEARMCHSLNYDMPWISQFAEKIGIKESFQLDSMGKFCLIADGSYDLYIKPIVGYQASSWDFGPGDLLVREAGGSVTDLDEERLRFKDNKCILRAPGIISTNKIFHDQVCDFIREKFFSI